MKKKVYAILMAGGKGTRLWPLSTARCPKSFIRIGNSEPAIASVIGALKGLIPRKDIIIVVDAAQKALSKKFINGIPQKNILVEPFGRSTASAIGLAAIELLPDDIMVVLPTDCLIKEVAAFRRAIRRAIDFAHSKEGALLCIGVRPREAKTSYGYIKTKKKNKGIYLVDKFIEKPNLQMAGRLIRKSNYLWNSGMFVFKVKDILKAIKRHAPLLHRQLSRIKKDKKNKKAAYSRMKNVSIDYQIMEKAKNLYCVKGDFSWQDLGNWKNVGELFKKKKYGNVTFGKVSLINTRNSIIYNSKDEELGVIGLRDMIVASAKDGTLICPKPDAEKVKELVAKL